MGRGLNLVSKVWLCFFFAVSKVSIADQCRNLPMTDTKLMTQLGESGIFVICTYCVR